jgi:hypothetical protein
VRARTSSWRFGKVIGEIKIMVNTVIISDIIKEEGALY